MKQHRLFFLDHIRIALTLLVILHHAAIAYGGEGLHPYKDPQLDPISPILFSFFVGINQSFFMAFFFFLSGYFTPRSLRRKGAFPFVRERIIRLGLPLLFYVCVLSNINRWILHVWLYDKPYSFTWSWSPGHLWFLELLLVFTVAYMLCEKWIRRFLDTLDEKVQKRSFLWGLICVLGLLTLSVRIYAPVGYMVLGVQPAHCIHYIVAFVAGTLVRQKDWIPQKIPMSYIYWKRVALYSAPGLALLGIAAGTLSDPSAAQKLLGGASLFSFGFALWESVMMVSIIIWLTAWFKLKYNTQHSFFQWMAQNSFTVYIIHQTVLICVHIGLHSLRWPSTLKFFVAIACTIPCCFILSTLLRWIPGIRRVVG